jgi:hypothetical protein
MPEMRALCRVRVTSGTERVRAGRGRELGVWVSENMRVVSLVQRLSSLPQKTLATAHTPTPPHPHTHYRPDYQHTAPKALGSVHLLL